LCVAGGVSVATAVNGDTGQWPDRMNPTDALLWFMDKIPEFRSVAGLLIILRRQPSPKALRQEFERLVGCVPRLRQRVAEVPLGLAPPEWIAEEALDLEHHLRAVAVPPPGGLAEFLAEVSPLYESSLDPNRPLWEAYFADGLSDGRGAVFVKMHHCLTDGVGGRRILEPLLGTQRARPGRPREASSKRRASDSAALLLRAIQHGLTEAAVLGGSVVSGAFDAVRNPRRATMTTVGGVRTGAGFVRDLLARRSESPLGPARSLARSLATYDMRLADVERLCERLAATVNDLALATVNGALHRWCRLGGIEVDDLRVLVPVDLREKEDARAGNRVGLVTVGLPVGEADVLRGLRVIQERMNALKADRRAVLDPWLARAILAMPIPLAELIVRARGSRASSVCASLPGPKRTCFLAGETIQRIYPYVSLCGDQPLAVSVLRYQQTLCVGIDADSVAIGGLDRFRSFLHESYQDLLKVGSRARKSPARRGAAL
jgi:diacylglycerol O-acyltransferase